MKTSWSCLRCCSSKVMSRVGVFTVLLCVTGSCVLWRRGASSYFPPPDRRRCACDRCAAEDEPLFMQRFGKCAQPFLTASHNLSEENFNWWKGLQGRGQSFSAYKEAVKRMFQMFPSGAAAEASGPDRRRTCAVVGNSVNLNNSKYGPLIDLQEAVIRINRGRTEGHEADVGTRTTHRVMYPESAVDLDNATHLVLFPFKIQDLDWITKAFSTGFSGRSYAPIKSTIKANKDLVLVLNPAFMRYVHEDWLQRKGRYPSTGFLALVLALHLCERVHVFGYGADGTGSWSHYWEPLRNKRFKTGGHPGAAEYAMIQELDQHHTLRFHKGW